MSWYARLGLVCAHCADRIVNCRILRRDLVGRNSYRDERNFLGSDIELFGGLPGISRWRTNDDMRRASKRTRRDPCAVLADQRTDSVKHESISTHHHCDP